VSHVCSRDGCSEAAVFVFINRPRGRKAWLDKSSYPSPMGSMCGPKGTRSWKTGKTCCKRWRLHPPRKPRYLTSSHGVFPAPPFSEST
jgi:hypothetical protein